MRSQTMIKQTLNLITTKDHQQVAVWHIIDDEVFNPVNNSDNEALDSNEFNSNTGAHKKQNLLFLHGAFSDKTVCLGIVSYFASLGHQCFVMEWRGHGSSSQPQTKYHLEDIAFYDVKATFDYLLNDRKLDNLHCITHSGGGICLTLFLTRHPEFNDKIKSICMVACQVFAGTSTPSSYAKLLFLKAVTRQLGYVEGKRLKLGTMNESYYLLSQWMDWNLNQNFSSYLPTPIRRQLLRQTGLRLSRKSQTITTPQPLDYRTLMPNITIPIYSICAAGDWVAPPRGTLKYLQAFKNSNNQWREFSVANGDLEDYNHTRIFLSRNASKEVWPTVLDWVQKHS